MTFDLNAARTLHERHADYPDKCLSCGDPTEGYGEPWPCATAVALGATGRSEWVGPYAIRIMPWSNPTDTIEAAIETATATIGAGRMIIPKIIEVDPDHQCPTWGPDGNSYPTNEESNDRCRLARGHKGEHYWPDLDTPPTTCGYDGDDDPCRTNTNQPPTIQRCRARGGNPEAPCIHPAGHTAMHTNNLGDLWYDLDADGPCGYKWNDIDRTVRCTRATGHPGKHEHGDEGQ